MHFNQWLKAVPGRSTLVCAHFGRTTSAISQWKTNGVPSRLIKEVRDFTKGEVTLEDMLPDPIPRKRSKAAKKKVA